MTHEEIYKQAVETYGVESQTRMAIEEMAELTNALMKLARGRVTIPDVVEEIADVKIMMEQLAIIFGQADVQEQVDFKTNRLCLRLGGNAIVKSTKVEDILHKPISKFDIHLRVLKGLQKANIHTLHDVIQHSRKDFLLIPKFGRKSLTELDNLLERYGLWYSNINIGIECLEDKV